MSVPAVFDLRDVRRLPFSQFRPVYASKEGMGFDLFHSIHPQSFLLVCYELSDEVCGLAADVGIGGDAEELPPVLDLVPGLSRGFAGKWRIADQHFEKNYSHRPPIHSFRVANCIRNVLLLPWTSGAT